MQSQSRPSLPRHVAPPAYHCSTQCDEMGSITALQLGYNGCISRYPVGTTLPYFVDLDGFPADGEGEHVAACLKAATRAWEFGPVQFKRVFKRKDAFFSVVYFVGAPEDMALAKAFFPNCSAQSRVIKVYPRAFTSTFREAMVNIFCHELGHVLGLRHEFAGQREAYNPSVCWDFPNAESVMNYYMHPLEMAVHELDIVYTNAFYAYSEKFFQGFPIDVVLPTA